MSRLQCELRSDEKEKSSAIKLRVVETVPATHVDRVQRSRPRSSVDCDRSPGAPQASPHARSRGADALLGGRVERAKHWWRGFVRRAQRAYSHAHTSKSGVMTASPDDTSPPHIASSDQTDRSPGAPPASSHTRSRGADALLGGVLSVPNAGGVASFGALNECSVRGRTGVVGGLVGAAPICTRNVPRAALPPRAPVR